MENDTDQEPCCSNPSTSAIQEASDPGGGKMSMSGTTNTMRDEYEDCADAVSNNGGNNSVDLVVVSASTNSNESVIDSTIIENSKLTETDSTDKLVQKPYKFRNKSTTTTKAEASKNLKRKSASFNERMNSKVSDKNVLKNSDAVFDTQTEEANKQSAVMKYQTSSNVLEPLLCEKAALIEKSQQSNNTECDSSVLQNFDSMVPVHVVSKNEGKRHVRKGNKSTPKTKFTKTRECDTATVPKDELQTVANDFKHIQQKSEPSKKQTVIEEKKSEESRSLNCGFEAPKSQITHPSDVTDLVKTFSHSALNNIILKNLSKIINSEPSNVKSTSNCNALAVGKLDIDLENNKITNRPVTKVGTEGNTTTNESSSDNTSKKHKTSTTSVKKPRETKRVKIDHLNKSTITYNVSLNNEPKQALESISNTKKLDTEKSCSNYDENSVNNNNKECTKKTENLNSKFIKATENKAESLVKIGSKTELFENAQDSSNSLCSSFSESSSNLSLHDSVEDLFVVKPFLPFTSTPKTRSRKRKCLTSPPKSLDAKEVEVTVTQRGRKRKVISYAIDDYDDDINVKKKHSLKAANKEEDALTSSVSSRDSIVIPKIEEVSVKNELSPSTQDIPAIKKRGGRKPLTSDDNTKKGRKRGENLTAKDSTEATVTCAVCNEEMLTANWKSHMLRKHNNLAWRVGDPPLDLEDQKLVMRILNSLYKQKLPLHCDKCGQVKKSVGGLLSHKTVCEKSIEELESVRVQCEFCYRTVLPVSMTAHLKYCKGSSLPFVDKSVNEGNKAKSLILDKRKRHAAVKADSLIQSLRQEHLESEDYWQAWFKNKQFWLSPELITKIKNDISRFGSEKCAISGCNFISDNAVAFAEHYQTCVINSEKELYVCKYCVTICHTEEAVVTHIKSSHRIKKRNDGNYEMSETTEDVEDEEIEFVLEMKKFLPTHAVRLTVGSIRFLIQHRYCSAATTIVYPPAYNWAKSFCQENYIRRNLFSTWKVVASDWKIMDSNLVHKYLPPLKCSANVCQMSIDKFTDTVRQNHIWKKYKLFESEVSNDGTFEIFCGGQIFAMAWLPTPFQEENVDQMLAVSVSSSSMDKLFTLDEVYYEKDLIQFWNFGKLRNDQTINDKPKLEFCIALDYGPIRHLEWCPSGCYDSELNRKYLKRFGLLAVGCTNSEIFIYSVSSCVESSAKIFKPKPVLKLVLENVIEESAYGMAAHVTKISWSKASGHQFIAAGYANGIVAVFDLHTESLLLKGEQDLDDIKVLMPYRIIKAHHHSVAALQLHYLNDGRRWIMSGSTDRSIKYWDLENPVTPISNFTKATVTDGVWINHWLCSLHSFDDCCGSAPTTSIIYQPRNFISEHTTTMYSNCHIWSITGSEWTNGFIQGNVMGELQGYFPHQILAGMDNDKSKSKKKVMLGYVNLIEKDLTIEERIAASVKQGDIPKSTNTTTDSLTNMSEINNLINLVKAEPLSYKEAIEKYGVVFCDIKLKSFKQCHENMTNYTQSKSSKYYNPQPNIYPLQSINKVAFNPNQSCYLYVAAAYQIGFVRVSPLNFLNNK